MANVKISELPSASTLTGAELVPVVQSGVTSQTTLSAMPYVPTGTGAVTTTVQAKLRETVSVKDFGAVGDGVTDDTAAIQAALTASKNVTVPIGTYLISSTINIPSHTKLFFEGGFGNSTASYPAAYFIKKSTMTTVAITLQDCAWIDGGGLVCQSGNTGDGVKIIGNNAKISNFLVHGAGNDGVRVGTSAYVNANSFELHHVTSQYNGNHGIYIHDGAGNSAADTNAGTLLQCFCQYNTGDGIRLGHCFWISVINCLTEVNTGWGLYCSGVANNTYPECRYPNIVGGDFNEGNTAGQIYDGSYFGSFVNSDKNSVPTTAATGLQGGGLRNSLTPTSNVLSGLTVNTQVGTTVNLVVNAGTSSGNLYPTEIRQRTTASNGDGPGLLFSVDPSTGTYRAAGKINISQRTTNYDNMQFSVNQNGTSYNVFTISAYSSETSLAPGTDNAINLGLGSKRWSVVYAATGTINTSDERAKQDIADLDAVEKRVAVALKGMIKKFRFKDAVETKGNYARIHVGVIAQEVVAAFEAEGLDATKYGLLCYDEWEATDDTPAGNRYGIRYEELLAFIIAAL